MTKTSSPTTKICSNCGLEKPLSAFVQHTGPQGASYGSVCAACRKSPLEPPSNEKDESTRSGTGVVIDTKAKVHGEIDKRLHHEEAELQYKEEREENDTETLAKTEKQEDVLKREKKHREQFLGKRSFLEKQKPTAESKRSSESRWAVEKQNEQTYNAEQTNAQDIATQEDQRAKDMNFAAPFEDTRVGGKIKFSGDTFKRFSSWIGKGSPIHRALEQSPAKTSLPADEKEKSLTDFVEKNWGPKGKS